MPRYRILVVDDSMFMRRLISDAVAEDPDFEVIGTAKDGQEAVRLVRELKPDAVTMDLEMPVMNGLEALRSIMADNPTPVVMLSSLTEEGAKETIRALELGAVDFVRKPSGSISLDLYKVKSSLLEKLHIAVLTNLRRRSPQPGKPPAAPGRKPPAAHPPPFGGVARAKLPPPAPSALKQIVGIGTSTGGPRALQQVLTALPADFPAALVVVQHMPPGFTKSLSQRLDLLGAIRVKEGEDGEPVVPGTAYIAPGGSHMAVMKEAGSYRIRLSDDSPRGGHRPSVDTLFESLLPLRELKRHIVIMTGMGSDGARSMLALREDGAATTLAEAEETCVVYGMPRSAMELNAAERAVPLHDIAAALVEAVRA